MINLYSKKIGVIMGGISSERDISLKSGEAVLNALIKKGLNAIKIDLITDVENEIKELISSLGVNIAFIALHGYFGEDGKIQAILDNLNIPYTGSDAYSSRLSLDKIASKRIFQDTGLNVPKYSVIHSAADLSNLDLDCPLVVKPSANGSSFGLSIVDSINGLQDAIALAKRYDENVIIEEYINGRELTVGILDNDALPVIEIVPKNRFFDFEAKYQKGLTDYIVPARIEENSYRKAQIAGLNAYNSLGCFGFSRVDMILRQDKIYILELNSIPGMTETSLLPKAAKSIGLNFDDLCVRILNLSLTKERIIDAAQKK